MANSSPSNTMRLLIAWLLLQSASPILSHAATVVSGSEFQQYLGAQHGDLQIELQKSFCSDSGYSVCGPIDPTVRGKQDVSEFFRAIRVICPNLASVVGAAAILSPSKSPKLITRDSWIASPRKGSLAGIRGVLVWVRWENQRVPILFQTINQSRLTILAYNNRLFAMEKGERKLTAPYIRAVSDFLHRCDLGDSSSRAPEAASFGLPESMNIVPSHRTVAGTSIISSEDLASISSISTDFAKGLTGIVPGDSIAKELVKRTPDIAYRYLSNETELILLANNAFDSRKNVTVFDLDSASLPRLTAGSYCFAMGLSGRLKIGKPSESNSPAGENLTQLEASLFPGEAVLCAGQFTVMNRNQCTALDISLKSPRLFDTLDPGIAGAHAQFDNDPIWSVGHLLQRLTLLGIKWRGAVIRKY